MSKRLTLSFPASEQARFKAWTASLSKENREQCRRLVVHTTETIRRRAVQTAPTNQQVGQGPFLKTKIHTAYTPDRMNGKVYTGVKYAPYQEWGTGNKVRVPAFVKQMFGVDSMDWKGKGLRKVNLKPQPYLFENARVGIEEMFKRLETMGFKRK